MNQFQLELAEMDRKRRQRMRLASVLCAAALIAVAMWSAGVPNASWFAWTQDEVGAQRAPEAKLNAQPLVAGPQEKADEFPRLRLLSTSPGQNASDGAAEIASRDEEPITYAAGALLENGSVLMNVYADRVVLVRGAETAVLYLEGVAEYADSKPLSDANADLLAVRNPLPTLSRGKPAPPSYTDLMRAAPKFQNDQIIGFDIYPGTRSGQFSNLGLHAGDLLVAVDGAPLTSAEALHSALRSISEGRSVVASVRRGDDQLQISLDGTAHLATETVVGIAASPDLR